MVMILMMTMMMIYSILPYNNKSDIPSRKSSSYIFIKCVFDSIFNGFPFGLSIYDPFGKAMKMATREKEKGRERGTNK